MRFSGEHVVVQFLQLLHVIGPIHYSGSSNKNDSDKTFFAKEVITSRSWHGFKTSLMYSHIYCDNNALPSGELSHRFVQAFQQPEAPRTVKTSIRHASGDTVARRKLKNNRFSENISNLVRRNCLPWKMASIWSWDWKLGFSGAPSDSGSKWRLAAHLNSDPLGNAWSQINFL